MGSGETADEIWKWRYVYAGLVYLACIPGVFAITLNVYLFLFSYIIIGFIALLLIIRFAWSRML